MNILITGSLSGIAGNLINKIKNKNDIIYASVRTDKELIRLNDKYKNYSNIVGLKVDITNDNDLVKIYDLEIDVYISNAAIGEGGSILDIPIENLRRNFEVNVFKNFEIIQHFLKKMIAKESGRVIIMGSLAGDMPLSFLGSYCSTKACINIMSGLLRKELKLLNKNIYISLIKPGLYKTGFNNLMYENKYTYMKEGSYFYNYINYLYNKESKFLNMFEKKKLNSISKKIKKAIYSKYPKKVYRAPFLQSLVVRFYSFFKD